METLRKTLYYSIISGKTKALLLVLVCSIALLCFVVKFPVTKKHTNCHSYFDGGQIITVFTDPNVKARDAGAKVVVYSLDGNIIEQLEVPNPWRFLPRHWPPRYFLHSEMIDDGTFVPDTIGSPRISLCSPGFRLHGEQMLVPKPGKLWVLSDRTRLLAVEKHSLSLFRIADNNAIALSETGRSQEIDEVTSKVFWIFEPTNDRVIIYSELDHADPNHKLGSIAELFAIEHNRLRLLSSWRTYSSFQNSQIGATLKTIYSIDPPGRALEQRDSLSGEVILVSALPIPVQNYMDYSPYSVNATANLLFMEYEEKTGSRTFDLDSLAEIPARPPSRSNKHGAFKFLYWDRNQNSAWYCKNNELIVYRPQSQSVEYAITLEFQINSAKPIYDQQLIVLGGDSNPSWAIFDLASHLLLSKVTVR